MRSTMSGLLVASLLCVAGPRAAHAWDSPKPQNPKATKSIPKPKVPSTTVAHEDYKCAAGYTATPVSSPVAINEFTCSGEKEQTTVCSSNPKTDWQAGKAVKTGNKFSYTCKRIPG